MRRKPRAFPEAAAKTLDGCRHPHGNNHTGAPSASAAASERDVMADQVNEAFINIPGDSSAGIFDHTIRVSGLLLDADNAMQREEIRIALRRLADAVSGGDYAIVEFADERAALIAAESAMIEPPEVTQ